MKPRKWSQLTAISIHSWTEWTANSGESWWVSLWWHEINCDGAVNWIQGWNNSTLMTHFLATRSASPPLFRIWGQGQSTLYSTSSDGWGLRTIGGLSPSQENREKTERFTWDDGQVMTQRLGNDKMSLLLKDPLKSSKLFGEKKRKRKKSKEMAALMGG